MASVDEVAGDVSIPGSVSYSPVRKTSYNVQLDLTFAASAISIR